MLSEDEMSEKRTSLEIIAPSVEEAVARGLADLGLPEDAVDVEVLDEGARGLFGLVGSRQARIRLTIKSASAKEDQASAESWTEPVVEQAGIDFVRKQHHLRVSFQACDEAVDGVPLQHAAGGVGGGIDDD